MPAPLFAVVSPLTEQKGLDLLLDALPALLDSPAAGGAQLAVEGNGEPALEAAFARAAAAHPGRERFVWSMTRRLRTG